MLRHARLDARAGRWAASIRCEGRAGRKPFGFFFAVVSQRANGLILHFCGKSSEKDTIGWVWRKRRSTGVAAAAKFVRSCLGRSEVLLWWRMRRCRRVARR